MVLLIAGVTAPARLRQNHNIGRVRSNLLVVGTIADDLRRARVKSSLRVLKSSLETLHGFSAIRPHL